MDYGNANPGYFRSAEGSDAIDVVCLSHLRWDFVYQRPQHLLSRCARDRRVFFVEEPMFGEEPPRLEVSRREDGLHVVVPHLPWSMQGAPAEAAQREMLDRLLAEHEIRDFVLWYYTPMALGFSNHLEPLATVYDCMDELSAFRGASPALLEREAELYQRADVVFTGGQSLYEAKRGRHPNVHLFASSIDAPHFMQARAARNDPADQAAIPHPRLGYFGVIDERMDTELLAGLADARPDWQLVLVGPIVKIDSAELPHRPNIHYLGGKNYSELPGYIAGWDVALLPFARNESTRFISPTKTPEYLAAGKPAVSTPILDVIRPYGEEELVRIAGTTAEFVAACAAALEQDEGKAEWLARVDERLARTSWDRTWAEMWEEIEAVLPASMNAEDRAGARSGSETTERGSVAAD
jgi:UDP-galactopyranose mutase